MSKVFLLAQQNEVLFHTSDLALLWNIADKNTLYTTIKRCCQRAELFRIFKGYYSIIPLSKLDPLLLGLKALHQYSYISTETVFFQQGIISQPPSAITLISEVRKTFSIANNYYKCRQMAPSRLYQPDGIKQEGQLRVASIERAVVDLLYYNSAAHFDADMLIPWDAVKALQKKLKNDIT